MITIIDYGLGNVRAFENIYKRLNIEVSIARGANDLRTAAKIVLPGVGAFDTAMKLLNQSGMRETLDNLVLDKHVQVLGICVGMQILARSSEEGRASGLGWIEGRVRGLRSLGEDQLVIPHMGWNDVHSKPGSSLFDQIGPGARFYFLHSYYFHCDRKEDIAATTSYGAEISCAVNAGNVYGVQFHPEKSHECGVQLLKNFAEH